MLSKPLPREESHWKLSENLGLTGNPQQGLDFPHTKAPCLALLEVRWLHATLYLANMAGKTEAPVGCKARGLKLLKVLTLNPKP
jgi:hypothetical protein